MFVLRGENGQLLRFATRPEELRRDEVRRRPAADSLGKLGVRMAVEVRPHCLVGLQPLGAPETLPRRRWPDLCRKEARRARYMDSTTRRIFVGPLFSDVVVSESANTLLCWLLGTLNNYPQPSGR